MMANIYFIAVGLYVLAAVVPWFLRKPVVISGAAGFTAALITAVFSVYIMTGGEFSYKYSGQGIYCILSLNVDILAAFFLMLTAIVGMAASIYGIAYIGRNARPRQLASLSNIFLLLLTLIFAVNNAVEFLYVWEMMAAVTFLLVNHDSERDGVNRAAWVYFAVAQVGAAFIFIAFAMLYSCYHSFDFSVFAAGGAGPEISALIFLFAFAGFAMKAGLVPAHGWLPAAHSAAPGNVSALLSAVMLKMALYGLIRFAFQFCHVQYVFIAIAVMLFGLLSAVYGIYLSLGEQEIKRILACSSIENMGLIFAMVGLSMLYQMLGYPALAVFVFAVALLHALNHALVKSSLFLSASTLIKYSHTGNLAKLGGLIKHIPFVGWTFVAAAAAVCGLPLLNCFVSEFLMFSGFTAIHNVLPGLGGKIFTIITLLAFGTTIALVLASFVRMLGVALFGTPRSDYKVDASRSRLLVLPQLALVFGCLVIGVFPDRTGDLLKIIIGRFLALPATAFEGYSARFDFFQPDAVWSGVAPLIIMVLFAYIVCRIIMKAGAKRKTAIAETWTCGIVPDSNMQYSAQGLSQPFFRAFSFGIAAKCEKLSGKILERSNKLSEKIRHVQSGNLHEYVSYILVVTVILLIAIFFV